MESETSSFVFRAIMWLSGYSFSCFNECKIKSQDCHRAADHQSFRCSGMIKGTKSLPDPQLLVYSERTFLGCCGAYNSLKSFGASVVVRSRVFLIQLCNVRLNSVSNLNSLLIVVSDSLNV